jgi:hypothetical protein
MPVGYVPQRLKLVKGTQNTTQTVNESAAAAKGPLELPEWLHLGPDERIVFDFLIANVPAVFGSVDVVLLAQVAQLTVATQNMKEEVDVFGYTTRQRGMPKYPSAEYKIWRELTKELRQALALTGISAPARLRLAMLDVKPAEGGSGPWSKLVKNG